MYECVSRYLKKIKQKIYEFGAVYLNPFTLTNNQQNKKPFDTLKNIIFGRKVFESQPSEKLMH